MNKQTKTLVGSSILALAITGCATTQEPSSEFTELENRYDSLMATGYVEEYAPVALQEAKEAIEQARKAEKQDKDDMKADHYLYVANKKLDTALEKAKKNRAEEYIANSDVKRKEVLLSAKEREASQALNTAAAMRSEALAARKEAEKAKAEAAKAKAQAKTMAQKAQALTETIENISAEETDRGLVLTMGSILFELNKATLKSGSEATVARVASLLDQYPDREILVEGFTDSLGSETYNQQLSEKRAAAVAELLVENGIERGRISTQGYGESYPVTTNETEAGRQQNRRVELVIANKDKAQVSARSDF